MTSRWNNETTVKFIQRYKFHECLWNFASNEYNNKPKRFAAYLAVVKEMGINNFGVDEVKNKIKNLRSTYIQEKKKILKSKKSGAGQKKVYIPKIKWLTEMDGMFTENMKHRAYKYIESPPAVPDMIQEQTSTATQESNAQATCADSITSTSRPNKRSKDIVQAINTLSTLRDKVNNSEDETLSDIFGKSVAMQLKNLTMENALLAQQKIQCILTEIGIKDYREKNGSATSMINYSCQSVTSPTSVQSNNADSCDTYQSNRQK